MSCPGHLLDGSSFEGLQAVVRPLFSSPRVAIQPRARRGLLRTVGRVLTFLVTFCAHSAARHFLCSLGGGSRQVGARATALAVPRPCLGLLLTRPWRSPSPLRSSRNVNWASRLQGSAVGFGRGATEEVARVAGHGRRTRVVAQLRSCLGSSQHTIGKGTP